MTDTVSLPFKITVPHSDLGDDGYHGFVYLPGYLGAPNIERRSESGRRHPRAWRQWLHLICNNPDCKGEAIVGTWALFDATRP